MGKRVLGPHRCARIAFLSLAVPRYSKARPGTARQGPSAILSKKMKQGTDKVVCGPHRRKRIVFLAELWKLLEPAANQPKLTSDRRAKSV